LLLFFCFVFEQQLHSYGKILEEEGKKKTPPARGGNAGPDFKRPFGCGVLNLSEINVSCPLSQKRLRATLPTTTSKILTSSFCD